MKALSILDVSRKPNERLVELLEQNVIGTPGESITYQHVNVRRKVQGIPDPYFCNLYIRDKLYGTICFCGRSVRNLGKEQRAFYIRYFTFLNDIRSDHQQVRRGKKSKIREEVNLLMDGEGLEFDDELLLYAYVDPENIRSKRLIEEFGFQTISSFHTIPFSRLYPKMHSDVEILQPKDQPGFGSVLEQFYSHHQLVSFENLFQKGDYFVIRIDGEIVYGVQGIDDEWKILSLPGVSGKVMMKVVPHIPVVKKLFNPAYRFVFLEAMYCKSGHEHLLSTLFESVLAHYKACSAILCLDPKSHLYPIIQQQNLGITHKLMGEKEIEVVVKTSDSQLINSGSPFFISGFDVL